MISIKEDLAFAEDLVLYQEEVIEHMWQSHSALKSVIDQKDEVINQLYNQVSELQDKIRLLESPDSAYSSNPIPLFSSSASINSTPKPNFKALQAFADREFNAADQVGLYYLNIFWLTIHLGWRWSNQPGRMEAVDSR